MNAGHTFGASTSVLIGFCLMLSACSPVSLRSSTQNNPAVNAATFHFDRFRTGWNANETVLTPHCLRWSFRQFVGFTAP